MKEEMARLKGTVAQIRSQCANDIRRRDGEIQKLKRHLEGRRGRDGNGGQVGIVVVRPGVNSAQQGSKLLENEVDLGSPEYSLKQETTEFLTQLSQGLSDENDALIGLVRSTLATLRSLQGLPKDSAPGLDRLEDAGGGYSNLALTAPPSYEDLAADTDDVLEHLSGLLTNPSFVPLEEVEIREDEIIRLRAGWEKMEARWKEAVALMDGWRKRMVNTGDTINLDDLRVGLNLGSEVPPPPNGQIASILAQEPPEDDLNSSQLFDEEQDAVDEPSTVDLIDHITLDQLDGAIDPENRVLAVRSPNARPPLSPRKVSFSPILEETTKQLRNQEAEIPPLNNPPSQPQQSPEKQKPHQTQPVNFVSFSPFFSPSQIKLALTNPVLTVCKVIVPPNRGPETRYCPSGSGRSAQARRNPNTAENFGSTGRETEGKPAAQHSQSGRVGELAGLYIKDDFIHSREALCI